MGRERTKSGAETGLVPGEKSGGREIQRGREREWEKKRGRERERERVNERERVWRWAGPPFKRESRECTQEVLFVAVTEDPFC